MSRKGKKETENRRVGESANLILDYIKRDLEELGSSEAELNRICFKLDRMINKAPGAWKEYSWHFRQIEKLIVKSSESAPAVLGQVLKLKTKSAQDPLKTDKSQVPPKSQTPVSKQEVPGYEFPTSGSYVAVAMWQDAVWEFSLKNPLLTRCFDREALTIAIKSASQKLLQILLEKHEQGIDVVHQSKLRSDSSQVPETYNPPDFIPFYGLPFLPQTRKTIHAKAVNSNVKGKEKKS